MLTRKDIEAIKKKGADPESIKQQIINFEKGFPYSGLIAEATIGNGILQFSENEISDLINVFSEKSLQKRLLKFVPASGAASRMFSHLSAFLNAYNSNNADLERLLEDKKFKPVTEFFEGIKNFAFYDELKSSMLAAGLKIENCIKKKQYNLIINFLLTDKGLRYASLPKGLLSFHRYKDRIRKAVEEHLVESAHYCNNAKHEAHIHFTLSPEHIDIFNELIDATVHGYENEFGIKFQISHSIQHASTDTIAVDMANQPFRDADDKLVFRPGGHGALIGNLDKIDADIVFIKNIDNIVPDRLKAETYRYKKVIGGLLLSLQEKIFEYLEVLDDGNVEENELKQIEDYCADKLMIIFPEEYNEFDSIEKIDYLFNRLNRPLRVCGMVKNEGEPGGGPFWVKDSEGETSLQIVETSQIQMSNAKQSEIFQSSTHFNPVDLVCSLKNLEGHKFELHKFVDKKTGFISIKSKDGRHLKAQELPGLWNGAMARWLTIFVEVPIITFNPVKTVNDLLRKEHQ